MLATSTKRTTTKTLDSYPVKIPYWAPFQTTSTSTSTSSSVVLQNLSSYFNIPRTNYDIDNSSSKINVNCSQNNSNEMVNNELAIYVVNQKFTIIFLSVFFPCFIVVVCLSFLFYKLWKRHQRSQYRGGIQEFNMSEFSPP